MIAIVWATVAQAGIVVAVDVGPAVPVEETATYNTGPNFGLAAGYRWTFGIVHLRPEVVGRMNLAADAGAVGAGGVVTFGPGVAFGVYGHVGAAIGPEGGAVSDAGGVFEIGVIDKLLLGIRAGWQQDRPDTGDPVDWFVTGVSFGIDL